MARMKLLVPVAGEDGWYPGQEVEVDEETAAKWCDGERAERVKDRSTAGPVDEPVRQPPPEKPAGVPAGEQETAAPGGERRRNTGRRPPASRRR